MTIVDDATATQTTASGLPAAFADLEPYAEWIIEKRLDRYHHRLASTMAEMEAFYHVMFPRLPAVIEHCNRYPIDDLPDDVRRLMWLSFSLIEVSFPVEVWRQGRVPDTGAASFWDLREPLI